MFMACDITSCSLQSCTWSLSCKINHSHETSLPGQVKVRKVHLSNMMGNLEGFYIIPEGWQVSKSFFSEISRDFACFKRVCFKKFHLFPGSFTKHIATISLKDWSHMEIMQLEYYSIRETMKDCNHQRTYLLNMNTLKFSKLQKKTQKTNLKILFSNKNILKKSFRSILKSRHWYCLPR